MKSGSGLVHVLEAHGTGAGLVHVLEAHGTGVGVIRNCYVSRVKFPVINTVQ